MEVWPALCLPGALGMHWGQASLKLFLASLGVSVADSVPSLPKMYYIHFDLNADAFEKAGFGGGGSDVK